MVAWGPGFRSDLAVEWESFRAARSALAGVVTAARARDQAATYAAALPGLQAQLASFLQEGKLKVGLVSERRYAVSQPFACTVQPNLPQRRRLCSCAVVVWCQCTAESLHSSGVLCRKSSCWST